MTREVAYWRDQRPLSNLFIVLTDGEIAWDPVAGDFDWLRTTCLPEALRHTFTEEPRWIDLRFARHSEHLSLSHAAFRDVVADLAAPLHGVAKDEIAGEEVRQHRRRRRVAWIAAGSLAVLVVLAGILGLLARSQRDEARTQRDVATSRFLASEASMSGRPVDLQGLLGLEAWRSSPTVEARSAALGALNRLQGISSVLRYPDGTASIGAIAFSPNGQILAAGDASGRVVLWDVRRRRPIARPLPAAPLWIAFSRKGSLMAFGDSSSVSLWKLSAAGGTPRRLWLRPADSVQSIALSDDGMRLAAVTSDGALRLWATATGRSLAPLTPPRNTFLNAVISFGPGREELTVATNGSVSERAAIGIWSLGNGSRLASLGYGHVGSVIGASFSADGRHLALAPNGRVQVWDLGRRTVVHAPTASGGQR